MFFLEMSYFELGGILEELRLNLLVFGDYLGDGENMDFWY